MRRRLRRSQGDRRHPVFYCRPNGAFALRLFPALTFVKNGSHSFSPFQLTERLMATYLIVRAFGRQLDELRGQASRISRGENVDWWVERGDQGIRFCFENAQAQQSFVSVCENFGVA